VLATRDIELTQQTVRELYAQGQAERARAVEAVLSQALAGREPTGSPRSEYLTTGQAARALGVSLQTIKNWVAAGHLRAVRLGGRLLVPRGAIQANLDQLREAQQQARPPAAAEAAAAQRQHESVVAGLPAEQVARLEALLDKLQDGRRISRAEREELAALERELAAASGRRLADLIQPPSHHPTTS
jgi:excisionase family DNA binding protein